MPLLSIRAYARHRAAQGLPGGTHPAVLKAIRTGRIRRAEDGQIDAAAADLAWAANSGEQGKPIQPPPPAPAPSPDPPEDGAPPDESASAHTGMTLAEASAIEKVWKAKLAELEYRRQLGELVIAKDVADRLANVFTLCRTKLLGVPTRVRQALPSLAAADVAAIEGFIREALEELANTTGSSAEEEEEPEERASD